ncbi:MAG: matrixin family metalloprotease [Candidatus Pacearchaeota archaeon]
MGFQKGILSIIFVLLVLFLLGTYWMGFVGPGEIELSPKDDQASNFSLENKSNLEESPEDKENGSTRLNQTQTSKDLQTDFRVSQSDEFLFYENLRYKDKEISYQISAECTLGKKEDALNAFQILENKTVLDFYEVSEKPEILIACQSTKKPEGNTFVAGEGGPVNITQSGQFNVIHYGEVLLIEESKKSCPKPNVAIHEILHALGFKHSSNENNIMYDTSKCDQEIGEDIPKLLEKLYEIPAQPDLVLEDVNTKTHGRYLDFNASIKNHGLSEAREFSMKVYTDETLLKENEIGALKIGYGTKLISKNIKFESTNFEELKFELESDYQELNKENNKVVFKQDN